MDRQSVLDKRVHCKGNLSLYLVQVGPFVLPWPNNPVACRIARVLPSIQRQELGGPVGNALTEHALSQLVERAARSTP